MKTKGVAEERKIKNHISDELDVIRVGLRYLFTVGGFDENNSLVGGLIHTAIKRADELHGFVRNNMKPS